MGRNFIARRGLPGGVEKGPERRIAVGRETLENIIIPGNYKAGEGGTTALWTDKRNRRRRA